MPLAEFAAHKEQFFAGMGVLKSVKGAQIGEFLPAVAGHFVDEGAFAVDDFVVGKYEDEVFVKGIDEAKGEVVVVVLAVDRFFSDVGQGVVHPAHVPFESKAEAAQINGARDAGPGGGFFGDHQDAWEFFVDQGVELVHKGDGV